MKINFIQSSFNFENVVQELYEGEKVPVVNPCPDVKIGSYSTIGFQLDSNIWSAIDYNKIPTNFKSVVLVLESPHKEEFDETGSGIRAANGETGKRLIARLEENLKNSSKWPILQSLIFDIVIINAVQYQCSLKADSLRTFESKSKRDIIFEKCFSDHRDLESRIDALNPIIVINLCTAGTINNQLLVHMHLFKNYSDILTYGAHPSRWLKNGFKFIK